ncbi:energy transducer TonB [Bradyrhizobium sp.]|uniref:energy transducer TonB family protein n=1 Tax=Bradyrhizobium sp. TaxID=376 RepID=UPI002392FE11|nr:energy transducer TonB [Bradyrhizobium sp.]MDE2379926.1 TonB family protein [Bradyrhizobium sp.]
MPDLDHEPRPPGRLWMFAAVTALALHLGGAALAIAHLPTDDGDDGLGASGAEFAVEMASPKAPDYDLPPGPDTEAAQESRALSEQKAEVKETELPKDQVHEAEDPDRIVTQSDTRKPKEDEPKVAAVETHAADESPAQVATARQMLDEDAREAEKAKAPSIGLGKDQLKLTADWGRKISAYFQQHLHYPEEKKGKATVTVSLVLNRRGNVVSVQVVESSGDQAYDREAVAMVRRSDPVPRPPAALTEETFSFKLPVIFRDEQKKKKG